MSTPGNRRRLRGADEHERLCKRHGLPPDAPRERMVMEGKLGGLRMIGVPEDYTPVWRVPAKRSECVGGARPCVHVRCTMHTWLVESHDRQGRPTYGGKPRVIEPLVVGRPVSCALDFVDAHPEGASADEVGRAGFGCVGENILIQEWRGIAKLRQARAVVEIAERPLVQIRKSRSAVVDPRSVDMRERDPWTPTPTPAHPVKMAVTVDGKIAELEIDPQVWRTVVAAMRESNHSIARQFSRDLLAAIREAK